MVKVAIIEDNKRYRERLMSYFKDSSKVECVLSVDSVEKFKIAYHSSLNINILLLDIVLEKTSGIKGISQVNKFAPDINIVMLTSHLEHEKVFQSIAAGAIGYLLKTSPLYEIEKEIILLNKDKYSALNPQVARMILDYFSNKKSAIFGKKENNKLSEKETQIVNYIIEGLSSNEIAVLLDLTYDGVQYHVKKIYKKVNINSRSGLIKKFINGDINF